MKKLVFLLIPAFVLGLVLTVNVGCGEPDMVVPEKTSPPPTTEPKVDTMELQKMKDD